MKKTTLKIIDKSLNESEQEGYTTQVEIHGENFDVFVYKNENRYGESRWFVTDRDTGEGYTSNFGCETRKEALNQAKVIAEQYTDSADEMRETISEYKTINE